MDGEIISTYTWDDLVEDGFARVVYEDSKIKLIITNEALSRFKDIEKAKTILAKAVLTMLMDKKSMAYFKYGDNTFIIMLAKEKGKLTAFMCLDYEY